MLLKATLMEGKMIFLGDLIVNKMVKMIIREYIYAVLPLNSILY